MSLISLPISIGADAIASALLKAMAALEASLVSSLMKDVLGAIGSTTTIGFGHQDWFSSVSQRLLPVEGLVMAPLLFAATIGAIVRQDMRRLARAWAIGLPVGVLGGYAAVKLAQTGINITDAVSTMVQVQVAPKLENDFTSAVSLGVVHSVNVGPVGGLISLVVVLAGLALWLELVLRSASVELAIFFMPLALAGVVWPATAHWAKRLVGILGALLLAKPVIVAALCLGDNALTSAQSGVSSMITGAAILLLAAFAPMVLLKLVPIVEVSAIAHLQGVSRQPLYAAERAVQRVVSMAAGVGHGAGSPPSADLGSAAQLLAQVKPDDGGDSHPLGPARPPSPHLPPPHPPVATHDGHYDRQVGERGTSVLPVAVDG